MKIILFDPVHWKGIREIARTQEVIWPLADHPFCPIATCETIAEVLFHLDRLYPRLPWLVDTDGFLWRGQ